MEEKDIITVSVGEVFKLPNANGNSPRTEQEKQVIIKRAAAAYEKYMVIYRGVIGSRTDDEETKHVKKILTNILHDIVIEKEKYLI